MIGYTREDLSWPKEWEDEEEVKQPREIDEYDYIDYAERAHWEAS